MPKKTQAVRRKTASKSDSKPTNSSTKKLLVIIAVFGVVGLLLTFFASAATTIKSAGYQTLAGESSGMVASRQHPGVFWWHRDGGSATADKPRDAIYAVKLDENGVPQTIRGGDKYPAYAVDYKNTNWEDIALDDDNNIWIGDIGANKCDRNNQTLVKVKEPNPSSTEKVTVLAKYTFKFPDPANGCNTWNSEAMFWLDGKMYIFAKNSASNVYRVDLPSGTSGAAKLVKLGSLPSGASNISVSTVSDDRTRLAVASHGKLNVYATSNGSLRGDAWVKDIISRSAKFSSTFDCACSLNKATVEGGSYKRNSRDLAFVSENKYVYYAKPAVYGDTNTVPSGDTTPPTVRIVGPADNSTVSGKIVIDVEASDNKAVDRVNVYYNETGVIREGDDKGEYGWGSRFNTTKLPNGKHTINVTAYDAAGNEGTAQIYINVKN